MESILYDIVEQELKRCLEKYERRGVNYIIHPGLNLQMAPTFSSPIIRIYMPYIDKRTKGSFQKNTGFYVKNYFLWTHCYSVEYLKYMMKIAIERFKYDQNNLK